MDIIEIENNSFKCRREKDFAELTFKEQSMKILTTIAVRNELMSVLSSNENATDIRGLAVIYSDEYPGDTEYKNFLEDLLEGRLH